MAAAVTNLERARLVSDREMAINRIFQLTTALHWSE
jgi:hypothetical protein